MRPQKWGSSNNFEKSVDSFVEKAQSELVLALHQDFQQIISFFDPHAFEYRVNTEWYFVSLFVQRLILFVHYNYRQSIIYIIEYKYFEQPLNTLLTANQ